MDEEDDDYDELDEALLDALEDDADQGPGLPTGPGLPEGPSKSQTEDEKPNLAASEHTEPSQIEDQIEELESADPVNEAQEEEEGLDEQGRTREAIMAKMNEEQLNQYEAYRRSSLRQRSMRKLMQAVTGQNANSKAADPAIIVLCGVAKMFVGELIESARILASEQGYFGPLQPSHLHDAYQTLNSNGKTAHRSTKRRRL